MMQSSVIAVVTEEVQNDVISALHASGVGHLTRVIRRERGPIAPQLKRANVETSQLPEQIAEAERVVLISPASREVETACLVLQRGASSAWTLTADDGWQEIDDKAVEIAATPELPARPVAPAHRSSRTFRNAKIRRRPRRREIPSSQHRDGDEAGSS